MDAEKQYRTIEDPYTQAVCIPRNPFGIGVVLTVANDRARVLYNLIEDNDRGGISVDGYGCSDRSGDGKPVCIDNRIEENKIYDNARGMGSEVYYVSNSTSRAASWQKTLPPQTKDSPTLE